VVLLPGWAEGALGEQLRLHVLGLDDGSRLGAGGQSQQKGRERRGGNIISLECEADCTILGLFPGRKFRFVRETMAWVKAFHIVFMVAWFAGLFYLPRLFVYHAQAEDNRIPRAFQGDGAQASIAAS